MLEVIGSRSKRSSAKIRLIGKTNSGSADMTGQRVLAMDISDSRMLRCCFVANATADAPSAVRVDFPFPNKR